LAALLAGQNERSADATDQSAASQQPVTAPPDPAPAGARGGADGGSVWSTEVQMQALMTTGVGVPQGTSETSSESDAASNSTVDAATLMQMARDAQGSAVATELRGSERMPSASTTPQDAVMSRRAPGN